MRGERATGAGAVTPDTRLELQIRELHSGQGYLGDLQTSTLVFHLSLKVDLECLTLESGIKIPLKLKL